MSGEGIRKIIHMDMDAFYASIEQRDNPELQGKPVAVGGGGDRGVVAAASYEARKFGVRSAMPSKIAKKRCPNLIFVHPRHGYYSEVSRQIMAIFYEYTDLVEPLSIDEAFLDVTHNKKGLPSATLIAHEIKTRIKEEMGLTASAGISINKFLAKTASGYQKPDGLFIILPHEVEKFVEELPINKFHGVGKVTAEKMNKLGIFHGRDVKQRSEAELVRLFGKTGSYYYYIARGIDNRPVNPHRIRKSVGTEHTFLHDIIDRPAINKDLERTAKELFKRMKRSEFFGRTLTLKIKYSDFEQLTRSRTLIQRFSNLDLILRVANELMDGVELKKSIRLIGLTVSNLTEEEEDKGPVQLTLDF